MTSPNTSTAVMARRAEPHDSLDFFPTPPWAVRALCKWLKPRELIDLENQHVIDPCCGQGDMVKPLREYFGRVSACDVHDYGWGHKVADYLFGQPVEGLFDWVIANPPFRLAEDFIARMIVEAKNGCAVLVRTAFLEGCGRYGNIYSRCPPTDVLQFAERVPMLRGRLDAEGGTATAYCWLVWRRSSMNQPFTRLRWIAPCRASLERPGDYPEKQPAEAVAAPLFDTLTTGDSHDAG